MTAKPIEWHEKTLIAFKDHAERERKRLIELQRDVERQDAEIAFRQRQITEAKKKGKVEYDMDRFLGGFQWPPKTT